MSDNHPGGTPQDGPDDTPDDSVLLASIEIPEDRELIRRVLALPEPLRRALDTVIDRLLTGDEF